MHLLRALPRYVVRRHARLVWLVLMIVGMLAFGGPEATAQSPEPLPQQAAPTSEAAADHAGEQTLGRLYEGLRTGNVSSLIDLTADRIDLTIFGSSEVLSRSQARYVLQEFFRNYPPGRVTVNETSPSEGHWFASANYWHTGSDEPLTIYLRLRGTESGGWELRELRFGMSISR